MPEPRWLHSPYKCHATPEHLRQSLRNEGAIENVHWHLFCRLPPAFVSLLTKSDRDSKPYKET